MSLNKLMNLPLPAAPVLPEGNEMESGKLWSTLMELGDALHLSPLSLVEKEKQFFQHVHIKTGQRLFTIGQKFDTLYIVHCGTLKSVVIDDGGDEQILRFPMKGDLVGIDGLHHKCYASEAVALTNCNLIALPFTTFMKLCRLHDDLDVAVYSVMSRELAREQLMASLLGSFSAESKVASFLVELSERLTAIGYSGKSLRLPMTRQEIGNYLGVALETVSRTLSVFQTLGLITVDQRLIEIKKSAELKAISKQSFRHYGNKAGRRTKVPAHAPPQQTSKQVNSI